MKVRPPGCMLDAMAYRVLLADDNEDYRSWLRDRLEAEPDFEVVAEARDGHEAVEIAGTHWLDIAIVDIFMPALDGIAAAERIRERQPGTTVVLTSAYRDPALAELAAAGPAVSFTPKTDLNVDSLRRALLPDQGGPG